MFFTNSLSASDQSASYPVRNLTDRELPCRRVVM